MAKHKARGVGIGQEGHVMSPDRRAFAQHEGQQGGVENHLAPRLIPVETGDGGRAVPRRVEHQR